MSSTNKTTYYELSQYVGSDKPTYLGDYNSDMLKIDTAIHTAADNANTALTTANSASSAATTASTTASTALSTAQTASTTATQAQTTAETALTNSGAAQTAAEEAETAARANVITNLAPAYDSSHTYAVGDLVTYIDAQGSGKLYKCIVAVTTPEAFNINRWDDVTTSEIYQTKNRLIYSAVSDGTKTYSELLEELRPYVLACVDNQIPCKLIRKNSSGDFYTVYNLAAEDSEYHYGKFSSIDSSLDGTMLISIIAIRIASIEYVTNIISPAAAVTHQNSLTGTMGAGSLDLYTETI